MQPGFFLMDTAGMIRRQPFPPERIGCDGPSSPAAQGRRLSDRLQRVNGIVRGTATDLRIALSLLLESLRAEPTQKRVESSPVGPQEGQTYNINIAYTMKFLTEEKLTIVGAAGMIGSNMAQTALMMRLTPNICLYDPFAPALEGVAEELFHCGFEGVDITYTSDIAEALTGAKYIVSSGGAARKAGMTREDLLKGNAAIAEQLGKDIRTYCPDVKHVVVIFNPADITGLVTLIWSGLKPSQVTTLAALDSTRLRSELAKYFHVRPDAVCNSRTYGGHGEQMAVFASTTTVNGKPLADLIGKEMPIEDWEALRQRVIQGGKHIIDLRGRSSFQSPAYVSIEMIAAAMGGNAFRWPAGVYVDTPEFKNIMMAMETSITADGATYKFVEGTAEEHAALKSSYEHLCKLRDEVISLGVLPEIGEWSKINGNL